MELVADGLEVAAHTHLFLLCRLENSRGETNSSVVKRRTTKGRIVLSSGAFQALGERSGEERILQWEEGLSKGSMQGCRYPTWHRRARVVCPGVTKRAGGFLRLELYLTYPLFPTYAHSAGLTPPRADGPQTPPTTLDQCPSRALYYNTLIIL